MFRWYQGSETCYVYLEDVPPGWDIAQDRLDDSRWFTRGWTLQELIAPRAVKFYATDFSYLGLKSELTDTLSNVTGIPHQILDLPPKYSITSFIKTFSVAERMSWAAQRETTRVEDTAYCLLGIFDVNMPLLYGEGETAFTRLQEEIMKRTDDQSLFAWEEMWHETGSNSALARRPSSFPGNRKIVSLPSTENSVPHGITNKGLHIRLPMIRLAALQVPWVTKHNAVIGVLNCVYENDFSSCLGIALEQLPEALDTYKVSERSRSRLRRVPLEDLVKAKISTIYIRTTSIGNQPDPSSFICWVKTANLNNYGYNLIDAGPKTSNLTWTPEFATARIRFYKDAFPMSEIHILGFLFQNSRTAREFLISVFITQPSILAAIFSSSQPNSVELSGIKIVEKPDKYGTNSWFQESLKSFQQDFPQNWKLNDVHTIKSGRVEKEPSGLVVSDLQIQASIRKEAIFGETVHILEVSTAPV